MLFPSDRSLGKIYLDQVFIIHSLCIQIDIFVHLFSNKQISSSFFLCTLHHCIILWFILNTTCILFSSLVHQYNVTCYLLSLFKFYTMTQIILHYGTDLGQQFWQIFLPRLFVSYLI